MAHLLFTKIIFLFRIAYIQKIIILAVPILILGANAYSDIYQSARGANGLNKTEELVVRAVQPGPKMWKIQNGMNELWILGILHPLPSSLVWDSQSAAAVLEDTELFINPPNVSLTVNPFKSFFSLHKMRGLKKNPNKKKLKDVLPKPSYERWLEVKALYLDGDKKSDKKMAEKVEKFRPMFAAELLYGKAIRQSGLVGAGAVWGPLEELIQQNKIERVNPGVNKKIKQLGKTAKKFKSSKINDIDCFEKTLDRLEHDLDNMHKRAIAWSNGDVAAIKRLPYENHSEECVNAFLKSSVAKDYDLTESRSLAMSNWVDEADAALKSKTVSFSVLPIDELLKENGPLAALKDLGYVVVGPSVD